MNARELLAELEKMNPLTFDEDERERYRITHSALRLLAAAEANDGTAPETDANAAYAHFPDDYPRTDAALAIDADFCRAMERERNGLAARVAELEPDAERLEWLLKIWPLEITRLVHSYHTHGPTSSEPRAAIDAAMASAR